MSNAKHVIDLYRQKKWLSLAVFLLVTAGLSIFSKEVGEWWFAYRKGAAEGDKNQGQGRKKKGVARKANPKASSQPSQPSQPSQKARWVGLKTLVGWAERVPWKGISEAGAKGVILMLHQGLAGMQAKRRGIPILTWGIFLLLGVALGFCGVLFERTWMFLVGFGVGSSLLWVVQVELRYPLEAGLDLFVALGGGLLLGALGYGLPRGLGFSLGALGGSSLSVAFLWPSAGAKHDAWVMVVLLGWVGGVLAALLLRWCVMVVTTVLGSLLLWGALASAGIGLELWPKNAPTLAYDLGWLSVALLCLSIQAKFAKRIAATEKKAADLKKSGG